MTLAHDLETLSLADKRAVLGAVLQSTLRSTNSFPLSFPQEQLWFMDKLQPGLPVYNIPLYVPFQEKVDLATLQRALETLASRHDMLRAHFELVADEPRQVIEPDAVVELEVEDLSTLPAAEREAALGDALNREVQKPFDLSQGVCVRYRLFRLDPVNDLLSVTMHHIVTDAWSLGVYVSELRRTYEAYRKGRQEASLEPLQVEYSDYARWQREHLRGIRLIKLKKYWTDQLAGAPHVVHLPVDRPRPESQTFNGTVAGFVFAPELGRELIAFSREKKVTLFMLLLACFYTLLYRYTGQEDILVGAPVANRPHPELEPVVGIFVNTIILRAKLHEDLTFLELLEDVRQMSLEAFEHQALPFDWLVDELKVERVPSFAPLYQVVFNFQNAALIESANPRAEGEVMEEGGFPFVHSQTAKVDLNLTITQNDSKVSGGIEYNTDLFDGDSIETMIFHFRTIAEQILSAPAVRLLEIPLPARPQDAAEGAAGVETLPATGDRPVAADASLVDPLAVHPPTPEPPARDDGEFDFELGG